MFATPPEDDEDNGDDGYVFGPYDLKVLIGTAVIAWAFVTGTGIANYMLACT